MTVQRTDHPVFLNQVRGRYSPIEELPLDMLGKILACLPDLTGKRGKRDDWDQRRRGIWKAVQCRQCLAMASQRMRMAVCSPNVTHLFIEAILQKYADASDYFTYKEVIALKKTVWERVQDPHMDPPFRAKEWTALEALPDEILRKIITYLPHVRGETDRKEERVGVAECDLETVEMQKTVQSRNHLGWASKRLYQVVNDCYTERAFIYAIIEKYRSLDHELTYKHMVAMQMGVWDYIRAHRLDKSAELTQKLYQLVSSCVKIANQVLKQCGACHFRCELFESVSRGFKMHSDPGSFSFDFSLNQVRIFCPFVSIVILMVGKEVPTQWVSLHAPNSPYLVFLGLVESLIAHFSATFDGLRPALGGDVLNEALSELGSHDYEVVSPPGKSALCRIVSASEILKIDPPCSALSRRGSHRLVFHSDTTYYSVYKIRQFLGEVFSDFRINRCTIPSRGVRNLGWFMRHTIADKNKLSAWTVRKRSWCIARYLWGNFGAQDVMVLMSASGMSDTEIQTCLDKIIAMHSRGMSREEMHRAYDLPVNKGKRHPLQVLARLFYGSSWQLSGWIISMDRKSNSIQELEAQFFNQIGHLLIP